MKNQDIKGTQKEFSMRVIIIVVLSITVVIWSLLYFIDKPNPKLVEDVPIQIALQGQAAEPVWMGAELADVTNAMVTRLELHTNSGVYVNSVIPESPAQTAGLLKGDVIVSADKIKVKTTTELATALKDKKAGDRIKLRIFRDNNSQNINIVFKSKIDPATGVQKIKTKITTQTVAQGTPKPWLGVNVQSIDTVIKRQFNLPSSNGVVIADVIPGSPAASNGLVRGDVLISVDGTPINDSQTMTAVIENKNPGDSLQLEILRGNTTKIFSVALIDMPPSIRNAPPAALPPAEVEVEADWLGLTLVPMDPAEAQELGLANANGGMVVDTVALGPGLDAGFLVGDIIVSINGLSTNTVREFTDATENARGAVVDIIRNGRHRYITVDSPSFQAQGNQLSNNAPTVAQVALNIPVNQGMRYVAVSAMGQEATSMIGSRFSRSPYFVVVDLQTNSIAAYPNSNAGATGILSAKWLIQNKVDAVITGKIGPRAFDAFKNSGISVYAGVFGPVSDAVRAFRDGKLTPSITVTGTQIGG